MGLYNIYVALYKIYVALYNIDVSTQMLGSFGGGNKTVPDASIPAGKKVVVKYGRPGYSVATYRIFKDDKGNTIKTEKLGVSTYPAQVGLVKVGAGKPAVKTPKPGVKGQAGARGQSGLKTPNSGAVTTPVR